MIFRAILACGVSLVMAACATTSPLDTSRVDTRAAPNQIVENMPAQRGARVHWGGRIIAISNQAQSTLIEVLSYPLGRDGLPDTYRDPGGRFVLRRGGFLEPQDYSPGRLLTTVGTVEALTRASVGQAELVVPLLRAEQLELWPDRVEASRQPRFGLGVGVSVGF